MKERPNILIVDDEKVIRHLLCDILADAEYNVTTASNGEEAIEKIKQDKLSIVITDLKMPGMSGVEVLQKLKAINENICVIIITAYPSVESIIEAMRQGAYDYIVKPFNVEEIKLVIRRAMERQRLLGEALQKEFYRELSILDGLTGVYNRRHFHEVLSREIERAKRYKHSVCLLMIDLDNFKRYNDTHGHVSGDKLLQEFSKVFVTASRDADMIFRYGGEEFVILYPETSKQGCIEAAKRLLNLAREKMPTTISIGLCCLPDDVTNENDLIKKADEALYQAKHLGKNQICVFRKEDESNESEDKPR